MLGGGGGGRGGGQAAQTRVSSPPGRYHKKLVRLAFTLYFLYGKALG